MNLLPLNAYWAIAPEAWEQFEQQLAIALQSITAGPVDDAERLGLPVRKIGNGAAVVPVMGVMIKRGGFFSRFFTSTMNVEGAINSAVADPEIDTIVLEIDSPGGSVDGIAELVDTVAAAAREKTVIAQVCGMAASAAFAVASQATEIVAGRMDLVGSIGVKMLLFDLSKAFKQEGIKAIPIDTGEFKSAGAFGTKITDRQIADFQRIVDTFFADFVSTVATGRQLTRENVLKAADGRVFFADEAIKLGLIDGIRTMPETLTNIATVKAQARRKQGARNRRRHRMNAQRLSI